MRLTSDFRTRVTTTTNINDTVHEIGHLMGLVDQHTRAGAQPKGVDWAQLQKVGNVMAAMEAEVSKTGKWNRS
ncbi:MAG: hypothetical protein JWM87_98 [Candidatus Eremiobacteraeota bacterium]|nr:hypothetical protein [Candidatus Eremiobacteraeota bacterium]